MNNHSQRPVAQRSARGITAVLLLGLASPLLAGPPGMGGMRGGFGGDMFRMERLAQDLDLDDYQRDRLEQEGEEEERPHGQHDERRPLEHLREFDVVHCGSETGAKAPECSADVNGADRWPKPARRSAWRLWV